MPCYATGTAEGDAHLSAETANAKATKLTRMLCYLCQNVEHAQKSQLINDNEELANWWKEHKRIDKERRKLEKERAENDKLKKEALKKLTGKEKKLLGLK